MLLTVIRTFVRVHALDVLDKHVHERVLGSSCYETVCVCMCMYVCMYVCIHMSLP